MNSRIFAIKRELRLASLATIAALAAGAVFAEDIIADGASVWTMSATSFSGTSAEMRRDLTFGGVGVVIDF